MKLVSKNKLNFNGKQHDDANTHGKNIRTKQTQKKKQKTKLALYFE